MHEGITILFIQILLLMSRSEYVGYQKHHFLRESIHKYRTQKSPCKESRHRAYWLPNHYIVHGAKVFSFFYFEKATQNLISIQLKHPTLGLEFKFMTFFSQLLTVVFVFLIKPLGFSCSVYTEFFLRTHTVFISNRQKQLTNG